MTPADAIIARHGTLTVEERPHPPVGELMCDSVMHSFAWTRPPTR